MTDRSSLVHDLGKLHQELRAAKRIGPNREAIVRCRIDKVLEQLHDTLSVDERDVASQAEYGPLG